LISSDIDHGADNRNRPKYQSRYRNFPKYRYRPTPVICISKGATIRENMAIKSKVNYLII